MALTNIKQETYDDDSYTVPCALYCGQGVKNDQSSRISKDG